MARAVEWLKGLQEGGAVVVEQYGYRDQIGTVRQVLGVEGLVVALDGREMLFDMRRGQRVHHDSGFAYLAPATQERMDAIHQQHYRDGLIRTLNKTNWESVSTAGLERVTATLVEVLHERNERAGAKVG